MYLTQISAGENTVYALDCEGDLYKRTGISDGRPEGMEWHYVYSDIGHISVSPDDELWVLCTFNNPVTKAKFEGTMARKVWVTRPAERVMGMSPEMMAMGWDYGISGAFQSLSIGCL